MDDQWFADFKEKLDGYYAWPTLYTFKFIVPREKESDVQNLFPKHQTVSKASSNGKYISLTMQVMAPSAEAVIAIYRQATAIEGIIAL
jgi:putative lipoic acid-binding regulatory protein